MAIQNKDEAIAAFKILTRQYGLQWTALVPAIAYEQMAEVDRFLTTNDRRSALGMRV